MAWALAPNLLGVNNTDDILIATARHHCRALLYTWTVAVTIVYLSTSPVSQPWVDSSKCSKPGDELHEDGPPRKTTEKCALFNYVIFGAWKTCLKWHRTWSGVYVPTNPNLAEILGGHRFRF